jgi:hypothetical protein
MSKIKYLCVDDEPDIGATLRRLEGAGPLKMKLDRPVADWAEEVDRIQQAMSGGYSGLLIDFRLDETHAGKPTKSDGKPVRFTAESLVSELRRRSLEGGKDESYPIVLWSTAAFLERFYELTPTYSSAYDDIWDKKLVVADMAKYARLLASFADGYQQLATALAKKAAGMKTLLAATDMAVVREFEQFMNKRTRGHPYAFQYALFICHDILAISGPLIDVDLLHAFLGVERLNAAELKATLASLGRGIVYDGIFSESYFRIWRDPLLKAIEALTGASSWLSLPADERVTLLKKKVKRVKFVAAKPIHNDYSTDYDCICAITKRPLAKRNGYRLLDARPLPWKEPNYVAGIEYRKRYNDLSKTKPLEVDDKERFCLQFEVTH